MPAFQSTLTKFSSPFRPATGFGIGAPIWQITATGSGAGSDSSVSFVTKSKSGTGSGIGSSSTSKLRIVLRSATGSAFGNFTIVISGPIQFRLGGLTDYSFPYLGGGRFYVGAPLKQEAATGSGTGASVSSGFATRAKMGTGSGTGTQSATRLRIVPRSGTGSAVGDYTIVISGPIQYRLGSLSDFSFPFLNGGRFYIGPARYARTATGSGSGTGSAVRLVKNVRQATGSGSAGESISTDREILIRTASGSGTSSSEADPFLFVIRAATGSGTGNSSVAFKRKRLRQATASGFSSAVAVRLVKNRRSASGSGAGTQSASGYKSAIRSATASGVGTASSTSIELLPRQASGSGAGATGAAVTWEKSHIFRVPQTTTYAWAELFSDRRADRLFAHIPLGVRAENLYRLSDGTYTINDPRDGSATREYLGGHNIFLTDEEVSELTAAGYGAYIT